jgi:hypothetical protein
MSYAAPRPERVDFRTGPSLDALDKLQAAADAGAPTLAAARERIAAAAKAAKPVTLAEFDLAYSDQSTSWRVQEKHKLAMIGMLA